MVVGKTSSLLRDKPHRVPNSKPEAKMVRRCVVVVREKHVCDEQRRSLELELVWRCVPAVPEGLVVVFPGLGVMQRVRQRAEDGSSSVGNDTTLHLGVQH